jgi:hypothetical protein
MGSNINKGFQNDPLQNVEKGEKTPSQVI